MHFFLGRFSSVTICVKGEDDPTPSPPIEDFPIKNLLINLTKIYKPRESKTEPYGTRHVQFGFLE